MNHLENLREVTTHRHFLDNTGCVTIVCLYGEGKEQISIDMLDLAYDEAKKVLASELGKNR